MVKRKILIFISLLRSLHHDQEKKNSFSFQHYIRYVIAKKKLLFIRTTTLTPLRS